MMKKTLHKRFATFVALILTMALIAGCTGGAQAPARSSSTEESTQTAASSEEETSEDQEEEPEEAEPEDADEDGFQGFPEVGETVNGFTLTEVRDFPVMNAEIGLFEHDATGALFMYIHNDDVNRAFDITFMTRAIDNTGLPHVFEHATLGGSEKYPSKDLFFNLSFQTYQTFMNALTYDLMTTYPLASLSEAQLLKLTDFYVDSCLHPMIMEDESIYREEAWRYRLAEEEDDLTIEGTVYSEMLGALDRSSWAYYNALRASFPGSTIGNISGGDPAFIPDMTYESLKDYHDLYYHPSNSISYLYGDVADYEAFLALLDEAFSPYEKREFVFEDEGYQAIEAPVTQEVAFAAEEGTSTEHTTDIYYSFVCRDMTDEELHHMEFLLALLSQDASDLSQKLMSALPYGTFSCALESAGPENLAIFMMSDVEREDAETFKETVDEAIADIIENGFPADLVEGIQASQELENKLTREQSDVGVEFILTMAYKYALSFDPWYFLVDFDSATQMDQWNDDGLFSDVAEKYLTDTELYTLVSTYAEPGLKEAQDSALAERLATVKEEMTEEEIAALLAQAKEEEEEASDEEEAETENYVKQLTAVTVDELPEEIKEYDVTDETAENGIRYLSATAGVDGVGLTQVMLNASGITEEDLHYLMLFAQLTGYLDTTEHTRGEIETLFTRYLYNGSINVSLQRPEEDVVPYLAFSWIANTDDLEAGYDLMNEVIFSLKIGDEQKLKESISSMRASLRSQINAAPHAIAVYRALGRYDDYYRMVSYLNGVEYYQFLEAVEKELEDNAKDVIEKLTAIQTSLHNRTNAVSFFAGDEETMTVNRDLVDAFFETLDEEEITPETYDLPLPAAEEALIIESNVQYNGIFAGFEEMGLDAYSADMDVFTSLVTDQLLYPLLRDQYGAYGVMNGMIEDSGMYLISYRDPNVEETFAVYHTLTEEVEKMELDQEAVDGYILSSYAYYARPEGELSGALTALSYAFVGRQMSEQLEYMRQVKSATPETMKAYAAIYDNALENGSLSVTGGAGVIAQYEDMFTEIRNPFGASDVSDASFEDLSEDDPNYEYVMQALQMGLLQPLNETTFGVDEDATVGEFALALFTMLGGAAADAEEAVDTLREAGVFPAGTKADDPLTVKTLEAISTGGDVDWSEYIAGDTATRGELARILLEE